MRATELSCYAVDLIMLSINCSPRFSMLSSLNTVKAKRYLIDL